MNNKTLFAACLFAALNICTLSARAESQVSAKPYTYGTQLDIKKVLAATEDRSQTCGVINAQLTYLDSNDTQQSFSYRKFSDQCIGDN